MVSRTARPAAEPRASASAAACPTRAPMVDARPSSPSYRSAIASRSEEHTSELQSPCNLVCRLLLEKKNNRGIRHDAEKGAHHLEALHLHLCTGWTGQRGSLCRDPACRYVCGRSLLGQRARGDARHH